MAWAVLGHVHFFICVALGIVSARGILLWVWCMLLRDSLVTPLALVPLFRVVFSVLSSLPLVGGRRVIFLLVLAVFGVALLLVAAI